MDDDVKSGEGELDETDTFEKLKCWFKESQDATDAWRKLAEEDFDFVAGEQYTEEEKRLLKDQLRPIVVFNRIDPVISAVQGTELQNRQEISYSPRDMGDVKVNEVLSSTSEWMGQQCNAEFAQSDAFGDVTICGMGWLEGNMDYMDEPDGMYIENRIDPLEMYWDTASTKKNLSDARFIFRVKSMPKDEAKENYPEADEGILHAAWADVEEREAAGKTPNPKDSYTGKNAEDSERKMVTIVEAQWWEKETYYTLLDPADGQQKEVGLDEFKIIKKRLEELKQPAPKNVKRQRKVYWQAFIGSEIIEMNRIDCGMFKYVAMTGKRDRNRNVYYGLVRGMKDPQRWANKWLSQTMHIINSNAKGSPLVETSAVPSVRKFEEDWGNPSKPTWLNDGAIAGNKIQQRQAITYPAGLDKLMEFAIASIRDASGVNLELLGLADRDQAGVLENTRKQAGLTILAFLFDALRLARKEIGKLRLYYIQNFMSDGRLVRVVGKQMEQYVPLTRDQTAGKYDVIVDESPTSPNQKEQVFSVLMQILPGLMKSGVPVPPNILDYLPLPSSMTEEWKKYIEDQKAASQGQENPEMMKLKQQAQTDQQKLQMDAQQNQQSMVMEVEKTKLQQQTDLKKAEIDSNTKIKIAEFNARAGLIGKTFDTSRKEREPVNKNRDDGEADMAFDNQGNPLSIPGVLNFDEQGNRI